MIFLYYSCTCTYSPNSSSLRNTGRFNRNVSGAQSCCVSSCETQLKTRSNSTGKENDLQVSVPVVAVAARLPQGSTWVHSYKEWSLGCCRLPVSLNQSGRPAPPPLIKAPLPTRLSLAACTWKSAASEISSPAVPWSKSARTHFPPPILVLDIRQHGLKHLTAKRYWRDCLFTPHERLVGSVQEHAGVQVFLLMCVYIFLSVYPVCTVCKGAS